MRCLRIPAPVTHAGAASEDSACIYNPEFRPFRTSRPFISLSLSVANIFIFLPCYALTSLMHVDEWYKLIQGDTSAGATCITVAQRRGKTVLVVETNRATQVCTYLLIRPPSLPQCLLGTPHAGIPFHGDPHEEQNARHLFSCFFHGSSMSQHVPMSNRHHHGTH